MELPVSGCCQCGAVTYQLSAEPLFTYACHCGSCQKRSGSAFSLGLVVTLSDLAVQGELSAWSRTSDAGLVNTRYSCASCGTIMYGLGESSPELAKLQAGTLADTRVVEPEVHIWVHDKQPWVTLQEGVPRFDTQPDDPLQLLQVALDYRRNRAATQAV